MDNNLPNDSKNSGNGHPPAFGSEFNPHTNPQDPNNPYQTYSPPPISQTTTPTSPNIPNPPDQPSTYSEVASHKLRDSHGRFATDHVSNNSDSQTTLTSLNTPNIFKRVFDFLTKIKWTKVTAYLTGAAALIYLIVSNPFFQNLVNHYFPNSSPILGRAISLQGVLKSSESGIYSLVLPNHETYTLHFKPTTSLTNLKKLNEVVVKGNLTWTPYVIENAEIYPLNLSAQDLSSSDSQTSLTSQTSPTSLTSPNLSSPAPNGTGLPKLYPNLTWEITQTKTLIFTSGRRKIEQQGVYLESSQVDTYPQDFINYYTNQLTTLGFKETLNSKDPNGITITYSKDDLFLTFGIKNVPKGSGDSKQITGYKAYIEHN